MVLRDDEAGRGLARLAMKPDDRYSRQRLLPEIGDRGQGRISQSRALVVGCGALGTMQASLLVRAGVGETVLIDRDYVERSNLQRQCLFEERDADLGLPKAVAAVQTLRRANSEVSVQAVVKDLVPSNAERLLQSASVILDGTDNYEARYLINDVAVKHGIPWVYGAAVGTKGSVMPVIPGRTACLACIFPEPPVSRQPTCDTAGVLNAAATMIASLQVAEALKILARGPAFVRARLASYDVWSGERSSVRTDRLQPRCRTCGRREFSYLDANRQVSARLCGQEAVQLPGGGVPVDLGELAATLSKLGEVRWTEHALRFFHPPHEFTVFPDGRAIVKGTHDVGVARSLYARYVGE